MIQPQLFDAGPEKLTERQRFAFDFLRRHAQDGVTADELGAALHARREKHDEGERCTWCAQEGQAVLKSLRKKGLAKNARGRGWVALGAERPSPVQTEGYDPTTAEIPY
jgi:hypothetical protein